MYFTVFGWIEIKKGLSLSCLTQVFQHLKGRRNAAAQWWVVATQKLTTGHTVFTMSFISFGAQLLRINSNINKIILFVVSPKIVIGFTLKWRHEALCFRPRWRSRQRVSLIIWRSWVRASHGACVFFFFACRVWYRTVYFDQLTTNARYLTETTVDWW